MSLPDTNAILREYLASHAGIIDFFAPDDPRIHCPRLPEGTNLPAVSFFTRGGSSTPYIPDIPEPSVQFDCWAESPIKARSLYRALYDSLQGIQNVILAVDGVDYVICSAREEVQGQDLIDEIPNYFRVLTFFEVMIKPKV